MRRLLFVDTSGWYAAFNAAEASHALVKDVLARCRAEGRQLVTSDYVLDELLTLVRMRVGHKRAVAVGEAVWHRAGADLVEVDAAAREEAWRIFQKFGEHDLSFTDCTSAAVMKRHGMVQILTLDRHFTLLGFERLPG
jgi:uncharacterized protein